MGSKYVNNYNVTEQRENKYKIKKCHFFDGKYFVVIDKSIMDRLKLFKPQGADIFFQQELTDDHCIILRVIDLQYVKDT